MAPRGLGARWVLLLAAAAVGAVAAEPRPPPIDAFSLADVELARASEFAANFEQNGAYLLMLDPDALLYNFRTTAGLDAPGDSYGGWEWSDSEVRGQFIGHYLSATAFAALATGRQEYADRCALMVRELKKVQDTHGNGYLSAFPESHFDRLESLQPVWAPYYVIHKLMAGLLDQHMLAEQQDALGMVESMAAYFCGRVKRVLDANGTDYWHQVLENEFGGMNEVLYNLHGVTRNPDHSECARWFDKPVFLDPLVRGDDPMPGLHANTHLAQVQGFAARYELLGDADGMAATANFVGLLLQHHTFSTGGSNWYEHWAAEDSLGDAVNNTDASFLTEESCTQYNILKLARFLFRHTGEPALADFYERAMLNGVMGVQKLEHTPAPSHAHEHSHAHGPGHPHSHGHPAPLATPRPAAAAAVRRDSHPQVHLAPRPTTHIHIHSHFSNSSATFHNHVPGDPGGTTSGGGGGPAVAVEGEEPTAADARRRSLLAARAAGRGTGMARPDDYRVVSWPGEPWAAARNNYPPAAGPGVYIYLQPLGTGVWKGDKSHSWSHGWGDPFNTFWCCYGTAIESFSKLADSIYFKHMPDIGPSAAGAAEAAAAAAQASVGGPNPGPGPTYPLPELYVNQLQSSSVRWCELRTVVRQEADLYGHGNAAVARLTIYIYPPDLEGWDQGWRQHDQTWREQREQQGRAGVGADSGGAGSGAQETRSFILNWRIPGWAKADEVQLRINGKNVTQCAPHAGPRLRQGAAGAGRVGGAPPFGAGARFCQLGFKWRSGDVVEAVMPMRVAAEPLNDRREELQQLRAIMLGPLTMAGLTNGTNDLVADPDHLEEALSLPTTEGLVSLAALHEAPPAAPPPLVRHCDGRLQLGGSCRGGAGSPLDATFRLTAPLAGCGGGAERSPERCSPARARQLLMSAPGGDAHLGGEGEGEGKGRLPQLLSFESASQPGFYLTADPASGSLVLQQALRGGAAAAQTFLLHPQPGSGHLAFVLEPLGQPGTRVGVDGDTSLLSLQPAVRTPATAPAPAAFVLATPAAPAYPAGARVLHGRNRDYLLVPIGQIQDELYTGYFRFLPDLQQHEGQE